MATTTEPRTATTLAREDITALRDADSVTFHHADGRGEIRAHLDGYGERIWTAREQRLFNVTGRTGADRMREIIPVSGVGGYASEDGSWVGDATTAAYHMIHSSKFDRVWQTAVSLMRPGDILELSWRADNNNGYVRDAGLHADDLHLSIVREGKTPLVFMIAKSVCQDNSARMVRRGY